MRVDSLDCFTLSSTLSTPAIPTIGMGTHPQRDKAWRYKTFQEGELRRSLSNQQREAARKLNVGREDPAPALKPRKQGLCRRFRQRLYNNRSLALDPPQRYSQISVHVRPTTLCLHCLLRFQNTVARLAHGKSAWCVT